VNSAKPDWFLSWDSDLLLAPGTIEKIRDMDLPISTVWTWLNRQKPQEAMHVNPETGDERPVCWQEPMAATAMRWEKPHVPVHFPAHEWSMRAQGLWRADVVLAFQMMQQSVYRTTIYGPHKYGEDIPFNWSLERRKIPRYCYGDGLGLHLYRKDPEELDLGWPGIMQLASQVPLAAQDIYPRDPLDEALGFYPKGATLNADQDRQATRNHAGTNRHARAVAI
jgi:hypothetical protein